MKVARNAIEVSAVGRVVMPGFVDSHTHLLFPPAGSLPSLAEGGGTLRSLTTMRLETRARIQLEAMARHGTTTVEVKTGCGQDETSELKILRALAANRAKPIDVVATVLLVPPVRDEQTGSRLSDFRHWACSEFLPKIRRRRLASFADIVWEPHPGVDGLFQQYMETARALGMGRKLHADTPFPLETLVQKYSPASIDHLESASPNDAVFLGQSQTVVTVLPGWSFHSGRSCAPARALADSGAAIALATNFNPRHTPTLSMQTAIMLACKTMQLTPAEAITAATVNGAHALGCADRVGSLEYGKAADLLLVNVSDYRELAHDCGSNLVHLTMKRGEFIYEEGQVGPRPADSLRAPW